jgi:hypothetical protein
MRRPNSSKQPAASISGPTASMAPSQTLWRRAWRRRRYRSRRGLGVP